MADKDDMIERLKSESKRKAYTARTFLSEVALHLLALEAYERGVRYEDLNG